jgi:hypothetical protein
MTATAPHPTNRPDAAPHDPAAERALLGSMMLDPAALRAAAGSLEADAFWVPAHQHIFQAIVETASDGMPADPRLVAARLARHGHTGPPYEPKALLALHAEGSSIAAAAFLDLVRRHARNRQLHAAARQVADAAWAGDDPTVGLVRLLDLAAADPTVSHVAPVDLGPILDGSPPEIAPTIWARTDGRPLIYPGRLTSIQTEPSVGKTWLALAICAEQLQAGRTVVYIDVEADAATIIERLRALQVSDEQIRHQCVYLRPDQPFGPADRLALIQLVRQRQASVVVIDTLAAILAMHGLDEDRTPQVLQFLVPVCRPLAREGAAVVLLDHVVKNREERGRWARGASGKLGEVDAAWTVQTLQSFSRSRSGHVRLKIAKDRYGALGNEGDVAADVIVEVGNQGRTVTITASPPSDATVWEYRTPTAAMQAVSEFLEGLGGVPVSQTRIETAVSFKRDTVRRAIAALIRSGHLKVVPGRRNSFLHHLVVPYRADPEPPTSPGYPQPDDEFSPRSARLDPAPTPPHPTNTTLRSKRE